MEDRIQAIRNQTLEALQLAAELHSENKALRKEVERLKAELVRSEIDRQLASCGDVNANQLVMRVWPSHFGDGDE